MIRSAVFVVLFALLAPFTAAQVPATLAFTEGVHYFPLEQPIRPRNPEKIEVVEVFWYGCSHCFHIDPLIKAWEKTIGPDVDFQRLPVIWNSVTELHARAFYAAHALNAFERLHEPLFTALNEQGNPLNSPERIQKLFANYGITADQFNKAFNAFGVTSQVNQAKSRTLSYRIEGTPELIVAGKYRVSGRGFSGPGFSEHTTHENMLKAADFLIAKERRERTK